ncbi:hypothetical protein MHN79_03115 [Vibrio sp. Of14-4]|uniref:hypothetical protein n=1 Tax=Vibrio sp. Of14-4 TaxID=2724878 RepID=UPI001EF3455E|nr:hypothetical protein [Vibrio sp. Of14-4]MCG7488472.1 hypothetical protein [Vibrio sp. Of14-4]
MRQAVVVSLMSIGLLFANVVLALPAPEGEPILWVSGKITESNSPDGVEFDSKMIKQLEQGTITTHNHVVAKALEYKGPKLSALLDYVGAKGSSLKVVAWDDYVATILIADIRKYGVLLATHEDGIKMTIDGKGPFFIVFPFVEHPELDKDLYYALSVWQVRDLIIE